MSTIMLYDTERAECWRANGYILMNDLNARFIKDWNSTLYFKNGKGDEHAILESGEGRKARFIGISKGRDHQNYTMLNGNQLMIRDNKLAIVEAEELETTSEESSEDGSEDIGEDLGQLDLEDYDNHEL